MAYLNSKINFFIMQKARHLLLKTLLFLLLLMLVFIRILISLAYIILNWILIYLYFAEPSKSLKTKKKIVLGFALPLIVIIDNSLKVISIIYHKFYRANANANENAHPNANANGIENERLRLQEANQMAANMPQNMNGQHRDQNVRRQFGDIINILWEYIE